MTVKDMYDEAFNAFLSAGYAPKEAYTRLLVTIFDKVMYVPAEADGYYDDPVYRAAAAEAVKAFDIKAAGKDKYDYLGDLYAERVLTAEEARKKGIFLTPPAAVSFMCRSVIPKAREMSERENRPIRILDPACGTGRFLIEANKQCPEAELLGVDSDITMVRTAIVNMYLFLDVNTKVRILHADSLKHETDLITENGRRNWRFANYWEECIQKMLPMEEGSTL